MDEYEESCYSLLSVTQCLCLYNTKHPSNSSKKKGGDFSKPQTLCVQYNIYRVRHIRYADLFLSAILRRQYKVHLFDDSQMLAYNKPLYILSFYDKLFAHRVPPA